MHVPAMMFNRIRDKKVRVTCVAIGTARSEVYEGFVVADYTTGYDLFIELDSGVIINLRYIQAMEILG